MPIQIIDNFELTSQKPIDNRLVVGPNSFYTNKDDITNKYNGLRIWELPGSNIGFGATNSTPIGLGYVWTGTSWGSENTTAISGGGTADRLAYFNSTNTIQSSNIYFNGTNIGVGVAAEAAGPLSSKLVVYGNIKSTGRFIGNGQGLTNLYAGNLAVPAEGGYIQPYMLSAATPNFIITNNGAGGVWTNPSSITVGIASALQTTRTIWGQNFNGTGNVIGNIVGAGTIQFGSQTNKAIISYNVDAARTLTVPTLGGDRTFAFLEQSQTFIAAQTMGNLTTTGTLTANGALTANGTIVKLVNSTLSSAFTDFTVGNTVSDVTTERNIASSTSDRILYLTRGGNPFNGAKFQTGYFQIVIKFGTPIPTNIVYFWETDARISNSYVGGSELHTPNACLIIPAGIACKVEFIRGYGLTASGSGGITIQGKISKLGLS